MAAIYDAQGNYVGDDGAPDLDQMKLELVKKNQPLSTQIPGYDRPIPQAQTKPDPLGAAAGNFTELATKFNPLMMAKAMQESVRTLNPAIPVAGAWADVAQNIQTAGAEAMYDILGNRQGIEKMQQNYVPVTTGRFYQEPTLPLSKEFEEGVVKAMDASKMPAMWPVAMNQPHRPMLTPNDVRVMGAEATRVGRQVRDIPTDFANAQSGLQKLDPITGQPTMGSRLGQVERGVMQAGMQFEKSLDPIVQDIMAKGGTSADILAAMAGQPLYAMRPEGSRLTNAVIPETSKVSPYFAVTKELISDVVGDGNITPLQTLEDVQNRYLRQPNAEDARDAFFNFLQKKAVEMYPDAPSPGEALDAYKARFSNKEASAPHTLQMYNEFLQSPEGVALAEKVDLPTAEEITARHETAVNWLNSQFTNYINEKVGTPNEPGIKLASQGLTYAPRGDVMESAHTTDTEIQRRREQAGMPALTATDKALAAANTQLQTLQQQAIDALTAKREQTQAAIDAGYGAPGGPNLGQFEPFAQASRAADKATVALDKQRRLVDNLQLGAAYENAIDTAIKAQPAGELLSKIPYEERQFYPALQKTPKTENAYTASQRQLRNLGFDDMARKFYDDVMDGSIPLDKVPKMTVEKYIRSVAEPRVAKERAEQAAQADYKNAVDVQFKKSADAYIPNDKVFGNVGALEITNRFTPEEVAKLVSEDTTALDVCIGEGGTKRDLPNLWHPGTGNRQYVPIYNVATGERNPDAPSPRTTYINAVRDGSQMVSFRDTVTGEPVAIFDFNPSSIQGKYNINFASGRANGKIKPEYIDGIKSYLNSRADAIHDIGRNIDDSAGIYDSKRTTNRELANLIDMPASQFERYDLSGLPRFITRAELRNYIENLKANEPAEQVPAAMSQRPSESLESYVTGAVASAIDNVLDSQRQAFEDAGEGERFAAAETFFTQTREAFNAYQRTQNPVQALISTKQRLYDLESEYANSNRVSANIIADGITDLIRDLQGHIDYAMARQAAEAARPRPFAQRAEPALEARPDYLRMTHDAALEADRDWGTTTADEVRSEIRNITEQLGIDPANDTDVFIAQLRRAADTVALNSSETILRELADRMESEYMRDWEPEEAPAVQQPLDFAGLVDGIVDAVSRNANPGVGNRVETIAYRVAERVNPRLDPEGYARALRQVRTDTDHVAVGPALRALADRIHLERFAEEPAVPAEPAPMAFRTPSQPEAEAIMGGIEAEFTVQVEALRDNVTDGAVRSFSRTFGRLLSERGLDAVTMDSLPELGRMLDGLRTDIREQLEPLRREGFEGEAVAEALLDMSLAIRDRLEDLGPAPRQPRGADLDNQRNDAIFQLENAVNDPELNPDDLRMMANGLSNPVDQTANSPWISLTDTERRMYAQALRERANYIEFSPADFAIRLSNEAGADIPDLRDTVQALNDGTFDHEILRGLPPTERDRAAQRTALNLNHILQGMQADANRAPAAAPRNLQAFTDDELRNQISVMETDTGGVWQRVNETIDRRLGAARRQGLDPNLEANDIRNGFGLTADITPVEREYIAREVADTLQLDAQRAALNPNGVPPAPERVAANMRDAAEDLVNGLNDAYYTELDSPRAAVRLMRQHLRALRRNGEMAFENIFGMASAEYEWSPELLAALEVELEDLIERYQGMDDYANGGPVRGYQAGGSVKKPEVKTPWLFSVPTYSETVAYEMYPGQKGQDDQRDAARHMLAAGTLSRKYGPKTAEFLGKAHEFTTSPLQAVKSLFGGQMPADYGMDTHNNAVGAELGQRAKSQAELEDLVQAEAERASRTQTQGQAFIKKANGGIVQENPTTDQMRYALTMRRK